MTTSDAIQDTLPEGWAHAKLGTLVRPSKEKVEPKEYPDTPYLSLEHVEKGTNRIIGHGQGLDVKSTKAVFNPGDVLYGKLRPYLNKVCMPSFSGICSTDFLVFSRDGSFDSRFLLYLLSSLDTVEYANHHSTGIELPRIAWPTLAKLPVSIPPLAEQKRIVVKVEALLERVSKARERLDRVPDILKRFRQSVLAAACSGRLTADWRERKGMETANELVATMAALRKERYSLASDAAKASGLRKPRAFDNEHPRVRDDLPLFDLPNEWEWVDLRFLMDEQRPFCYGVVQPGAEADDGNFLVRAGDLENGSVNTSQLRTISAQVDSAYERSRLDGGEVLVTVVGANAGVASIAPESCRGFNIARAVAKLPIRDFNAAYLLNWLTSSTAVEWMKRDAREVARPTLNLEQLRTLPVPLPPIAEQEEIVQRVAATLDIIQRAEQRLKDAGTFAERISQSTLAEAFAGELVEPEADLARREGRDYEPASVLLERIAAERAAAENGKSKRSRMKTSEKKLVRKRTSNE